MLIQACIIPSPRRPHQTPGHAAAESPAQHGYVLRRTVRASARGLDDLPVTHFAECCRLFDIFPISDVADVPDPFILRARPLGADQFPGLLAIANVISSKPQSAGYPLAPAWRP